MEQHYDPKNGKVWKEYYDRKERKESLIRELEILKTKNQPNPLGFDANQFMSAWGKMESKFLRFRRAKGNCNHIDSDDEDCLWREFQANAAEAEPNTAGQKI